MTRARVIAIGLAAVLAAPPATYSEIDVSVDLGDGEVCVGTAHTPSDTVAFARAAVRVLLAAGHDPADYVLEVRREHPATPYASPAGAARLTSAIFLPRGPRGYAVRVNASHPCVLTWVWRPARFTPWQRSIVRRAEQAAREAGYEPFGSEGSDVRVLESRSRIGVELWSRGPTGREQSEFFYEIDKQAATDEEVNR